MFFGNIGFRFGMKDNHRDLFLPGDADAAANKLADALQWTAELQKLQSHYATPRRIRGTGL